MIPSPDWNPDNDYTVIKQNGNLHSIVESHLIPSDITGIAEYPSGNYEVSTWKRYSNYWKRENYYIFAKD